MKVGFTQQNIQRLSLANVVYTFRREKVKFLKGGILHDSIANRVRKTGRATPL